MNTVRFLRYFPWRRESPATPSARTTFIESVHIFVLTAFAIAQPVYDRLGDRPAFLADMGARRASIVILAAVISLFVPAVLAALVWGTGRFAPRARGLLYSVVVFLLLVVVCAPIVNRIKFLPPWLAIGLILVAGAAAAWAYFGLRRVRSAVTVAAPGIVVFPVLFLLHSPVARHFFFPAQKIEIGHWNPVPVVVLVLDEICGMTLVNEGQEIDGERFPNFARLASESTWFRNATTVYPDTLQAVPAILSGKYPSTKWIPMPADLPQTLFSALDATGEYEMAVFEPVSRLGPERAGTEPRFDSNPIIKAASIIPVLGRVFLFDLTPDSLRFSVPEIPRLWFGFHDRGKVDRRMRRGTIRYSWGEDRLDQFDHFLECLDDSTRPTLYFFHVLLPHVPWIYLPSGRKCIAESAEWELFGDSWGTDELYVAQSQQRHLLQLEFTDSQIGRVLDRLRETGLYDRCLLVVTGDHGVSFKVGDARRALTETNRADIMSVPLFIKTPGQHSNSISDKNVETIDILPTIAGVLGIDLQLSVDGRSIFDAVLPERAEKTIYTEVTVNSVPPKFPANVLSSSIVPEELHRRFGPSSDRESLFRIGPHPELIGRRVTALTESTSIEVEIALIRSGTRYTNNRDDLVPCYIEGRVVSPVVSAEPVVLAIAVNGTIRAVTRTYLFDGIRDRFAAMVPESAFHEGENEVEYYAVAGAAPVWRLSRCIVKAATAD